VTGVRESMVTGSGDSIALRPGVAWPMWSHVTDPTARRALEASLVASRWLEKWAGVDAREDRAWRAILRGFARTGRAQDIQSIATATGLNAPAVVASLQGLHRRDMLVLDDSSLSVSAAYPFCAWASEHRVAIAGGASVQSLCAIDALGAGAMLGRDTIVDSACRFCGTPVRIATRDSGRALGSVSPSTAVVWAGQRYADNCSATSGCTLKAFFCSEAHLAAWRERADRDGVGFTLALEAALQIGLALFPPLLMPARSAESEPSAL
jgi:mercuric reductase